MTGLFVLSLIACDRKDAPLPASAGAQGEVLVVMGKGHWEGEPGATVRSILEQAIPGMPQREGRFKVAQTTPENFGSLLSVHHCVLLCLIDPSADTVAVRILRDRYAKGQVVVHISAHDPVTWMRLFQRNALEVVELVEVHQRDRIAQRLRKERDPALRSSLSAQLGVSIDVPGGFHVMEQDGRFAWLERDRIVTSGGLDHNVVEGLLIYRQPYESDSTFTVPYLTDLRDAVTRRNVDGPNEGSYMIVQRGFEGMDLMPNGRSVTHRDGYAYEMRGLFGMYGAKMGGPFVNLTVVDEDRKELVTVDGFVYAPQFEKREYLRELEAIVFSMDLAPVASP